jgi:hypothetical protein
MDGIGGPWSRHQWAGSGSDDGAPRREVDHDSAPAWNLAQWAGDRGGDRPQWALPTPDSSGGFSGFGVVDSGGIRRATSYGRTALAPIVEIDGLGDEGEVAWRIGLALNEDGDGRPNALLPGVLRTQRMDGRSVYQLRRQSRDRRHVRGPVDLGARSSRHGDRDVGRGRAGSTRNTRRDQLAHRTRRFERSVPGGRRRARTQCLRRRRPRSRGSRAMSRSPVGARPAGSHELTVRPDAAD